MTHQPSAYMPLNILNLPAALTKFNQPMTNGYNDFYFYDHCGESIQQEELAEYVKQYLGCAHFYIEMREKPNAPLI